MIPDLKALAAPTPPDEIKQRQGPGGKKLDYIDARFTMDRFDAACGPENWQDRYEDTGASVRCGIGVLVAGEWIWKWDVGDQSDIEPIKGAHSDAFKRAGVKWGVGRDLYGDHAPAQRSQSAPQRPQNAPQAPRPAAAQSTPTNTPPSGLPGLSMQEFFAAAEAAGVDKRRISDVAKDLFGQWSVKALAPEQRVHLLEELTSGPKASGPSAPPTRPTTQTPSASGTNEPEPVWGGVA